MLEGSSRPRSQGQALEVCCPVWGLRSGREVCRMADTGRKVIQLWLKGCRRRKPASLEGVELAVKRSRSALR